MSKQRHKRQNRIKRIVMAAKPLRAAPFWDHFATVNMLPDDMPTLSVRHLRDDGLLQDQRMILNYFANASEKWIAETQTLRVKNKRSGRDT